MAAGIASSISLDAARAETNAPKIKPFSFVQISDTHIGFKYKPNPDALGTFEDSLAKIANLAQKPDLILHTGDISLTSSHEQFDTAKQLLNELNIPVFYVAGEADTRQASDPSAYMAHFGAGTKGDGWYSFDINGVHFIALVNAVHNDDAGMGILGEAQIKWLEADVAGLSSETPLIVFAHMPLWDLYPAWGVGTVDAKPALALLKRFGSVTVLNGHVHQIQQKIEGNMAFYTARSTGFPLNTIGDPAGFAPPVLPREDLLKAIGLRTIDVREGTAPIALIDHSLG
jgi:3',5'-cyclic AMP phosphodiesterase CpdA